MRLTLDEERQMLDEVRGWRAVPVQDLERLLEQRRGVAWVDQLRAATAETRGRMDRLRTDTVALRHSASTRPLELAAMLAAGVFRCFAASHCEHAVHGDRPLIALLAARVITCEACLLRYIGAVAGADQRNATGVDCLCDFCLEEPEDNLFVQTIVPFGPTTVLGDMCRSCHERVKVSDDD